MKTALVLWLLSQAPDAPINPDEPGRALIIEAGEVVPFRAACLDEQEDVRRERARVMVETSAAEWKTAAVAGIGVSAALTVALVVVGVLAVRR